LDVFPTLCDLIETETPPSVQGKSFATTIRNPDKMHRDCLYFAYKEYQRAVRDKRFKLIEYHVDHNRTTQLFDLDKDPWETNNLANDPNYKNHLERLRKSLKSMKSEFGDRTEEGKKFWEHYDTCK
jgi:arylsulfatase A-like enzyme